MTNSTIIQTTSKVIKNSAYGQQKSMASDTCKDIIDRMTLIEDATDFKGQFIDRMALIEEATDIKGQLSSSLTSEDQKIPPDIYVINEKGKPVQYIMCVWDENFDPLENIE